MNTVYFGWKGDDKSRREQIYQGQIFVYCAEYHRLRPLQH